ncbi:glycosyltransferase family 2 protein [Propionivibrio sp.]|uniref:glycosyltransferase family 2 protein n=1 Tax=Propionivibrio sp. TaxID=2212460 RepID=UPI003BF1EB64
MSNPLVSVCIPTYRGSAFLAAAIDSVLNQSYQHFEIWILDDNSPDDTPAVVSRYSDSRITYLRNTHNLGPEGNWNRCLELAQGKYFKLLPHDDVLAADCLEKQVMVLEADKAGEIALVFGSREIIDPEGRVMMIRGLPGARAGRIEGRKLIKRCIRAGTNLIGEPGNGLFRRELVKHVGVYDATHPYLVDLDYWFRILVHGDAHYTSTRTSSFRVCPGSWSVAIGGKQYRDFKGFVDKFQADTKFQISRTDRAIGLVRARLNTVARALVYRYLFSGK